MNSSISNARLAQMVKAVAKNVSPITVRKQKLLQMIEASEEKYRLLLEKAVAKHKEEYDNLVAQQELFEAPIRKLTGGYSTEDLVTSELVETGTDKDGKPVRKTRYVLKYPDTIIPPTENPESEAAATNAEMIDTPAPEREVDAPFEGVNPEEGFEEDQDKLPFED